MGFEILRERRFRASVDMLLDGSRIDKSESQTVTAAGKAARLENEPCATCYKKTMDPAWESESTDRHVGNMALSIGLQEGSPQNADGRPTG
jgi:hypothetical protein